MATNFEYYKDKILEISKGAFSLALKNGKVYSCQEVHCNECDFHKHNMSATCNAPKFEWLYAEHIEQPKLTKRERAFCEAVQTGWIARDEGGTLYWFPQNESVKKMASIWSASEYSNISFMILDFSFIKWSDEKPWSVADLLNLDVMEVQHETD